MKPPQPTYDNYTRRHLATARQNMDRGWSPSTYYQDEEGKNQQFTFDSYKPNDNNTPNYYLDDYNDYSGQLYSSQTQAPRKVSFNDFVSSGLPPEKRNPSSGKPYWEMTTTNDFVRGPDNEYMPRSYYNATHSPAPRFPSAPVGGGFGGGVSSGFGPSRRSSRSVKTPAPSLLDRATSKFSKIKQWQDLIKGGYNPSVAEIRDYQNLAGGSNSYNKFLKDHLGKTISDPRRMTYEYEQRRYKSPEYKKAMNMSKAKSASKRAVLQQKLKNDLKNARNDRERKEAIRNYGLASGMRTTVKGRY